MNHATAPAPQDERVEELIGEIAGYLVGGRFEAADLALSQLVAYLQPSSAAIS